MRMRKKHAAKVIENNYIDYRRGKRRRQQEDEVSIEIFVSIEVGKY